MRRRAAAIAATLVTSTLLGCGHQVTPNPPVNDLSGDILVRLRTAAPLDPAQFIYMIAIDLCGSAVPYPQAAFTGYFSYSYAFLIGAGFNTAYPILREYYVTGGNLAVLPVNNLSPSTTVFELDDNGQGNEMELIFSRADLNNPLNLGQPCPNTTASPGPVQGISTWTFNMMTFDSHRVPLDSLGQFGPTDQSFSGIVVDTTTTNTQTYPVPAGHPTVNNPSAQLIYGEVDNYL